RVQWKKKENQSHTVWCNVLSPFHHNKASSSKWGIESDEIRTLSQLQSHHQALRSIWTSTQD
ncbi:unnamed protein product, partial [Linum tenue]